MKILSTNLATPEIIEWNGRSHTTGICKRPRAEGIFLHSGGVQGDTVGNPEVHGGRFKACYLFSADTYPYWQGRYPGLAWDYGMFGENLSVEGLEEHNLAVGAEYMAGEARLRITTPREPCYKLGVRFGDQQVIEDFIAHGRPGAYAEVIQEGSVKPGDRLELVEPADGAMSVARYFGLLYSDQKDPALLAEALGWPFLSKETRSLLRRWHGSLNAS